MKIVVATQYQLAKFGREYSKDLSKADVIMKDAKVTSDYVEKSNANYESTGKWYEVDEKKTKENTETRGKLESDRKAAVKADKAAIDVQPGKEATKTTGSEGGGNESPSRADNVKDAKVKVSEMETVEAIDAYVTSEEDRKGITDAVTEKKAELAG